MQQLANGYAVKRLYLARNGVLLYGPRMIAKVPTSIGRVATWLYWDVWWGSWLSWRLTCNPKTTYLVALLICGITIAVTRRRLGMP